MPEPRFIHLRLHSAYSLLEGAIPVEQAARAVRRRRNAGGRADRQRQPVRGARVLRGRRQGEGADPADRRLPAGARLRRAASIRATGPRRPAPVVLLAQDETGFGNLLKLSSLNYLDCGARRAARDARGARGARARG